MSKTYDFRFSANKAEFGDGFVTVACGASSYLKSEFRTMTFADAMVYLKEFSANVPAPHAAFVTMANVHDRKPPGYAKAVNVVYKEFNEGEQK